MDDSQDNILFFEGCTSLDILPEKVLRGAEKENLNRVVVLGDTDEDFYLASSAGSVAEIIFLMEQAKFRLLNGDYDVEFESDENEL